MVASNIDLSVGSVLGLSAYLSADMFTRAHGIPIVVVFVVGLAIGLACGVVNGAIVTSGAVPSLVVTLATLYVISGLDIILVGRWHGCGKLLPNGFLSIAERERGSRARISRSSSES